MTEQNMAVLSRLRAAVEADPSCAGHWLGYIDALILAGMPDDALRVLSQGRQIGLAGPECDRLAGRAMAGASDGALLDMAIGHHNAGRLGQAIEGYRLALSRNPRNAWAFNNLGAAYLDSGELAEAERCCRQALDIDPGIALAHTNLSSIHFKSGRLDEAETCSRQALALAPDHALAHGNLGTILCEKGRPGEAEAHFRRAVGLAPTVAAHHEKLGNCLRLLGRLGEAEACLRRAVELEPRGVTALSDLGGILHSMGRLEEAEAIFRRSIQIAPDYAMAYNNLGSTAQDMGRLEEAKANFRHAIGLAPEFATARYNLATVQMLEGDFRAGLDGYEYRFASLNPPRPHVQRRWQGESLAGRRLLVWGEQGIGDELAFFAVLPELLALGATCVVECDSRMVPLLRRSLPMVEAVARKDPPDPRCLDTRIDFQVPVGTAALVLLTTRDDFLPLPSYLLADTATSLRMRNAYSPDGRLLVGLSWWSRHQRLGERFSIPLARWKPVLDVPGVRFVSLQYGDCRDEVEKVSAATGVDILFDDSVDALTDLDRFAAQVAAMDLVVSIDNSTVSMACALGIPVWNLLVTVPDWKMGMEGDTNPWHACLRLIRQRTRNDWDPVLREAAARLRREVAGTRPAHPIHRDGGP